MNDRGVHVVWFKRDLRTLDHGALVEATSRGPTVGLYVDEPIVLGAREHDASHRAFVVDCLREVRDRMRVMGSDLLLREGDAVDVLDRLREELGFTHLWSHEETGLRATYDRDLAVHAWCARAGVRWTEVPQHGVSRPLKSRDGWARKWRGRMDGDVLDEPVRAAPPEGLASIDAGEIREAPAIGLEPTTITDVQPGGQVVGLGVLRSFLWERGERYQAAMASPWESERACSRISPHLAYGSVSVRTAYHAALEREASLSEEAPSSRTWWRKSITSFHKRLRWHCHFMQKLEDEPDIEFRNMNRAYDGLREEDEGAWGDTQHARFEAWKDGATGYPLVDACMRCLNETGWITFRMRAMVMSFASYHLWLHWKPTAAHLATRFVDFEPGIHYSQCQMQSGVTGINTVRIYSPIKQVTDNDPEGLFIRRWVPELDGVPDEFLPEPHKMPGMTQHLAGCSIGEDYPAPVVTHASAYRSARDKIFAVRKTAAARAEAQRVYVKHGSRKRPGTRVRRERPMDDRGGAVELFGE